MRWYLMALGKYAQFGGRSQRKEFWYFFLFYSLFSIPFGVVDMFLIGTSILGTIYFLAFLTPSLAVGVRRLHDMGRSGWWMLLYTGIVLQQLASGIKVSGRGVNEEAVVAIVFVVAAVCTIVLIVFMVRKSQPGHNRYGPDPREAASPAA